MSDQWHSRGRPSLQNITRYGSTAHGMMQPLLATDAIPEEDSDVEESPRERTSTSSSRSTQSAPMQTTLAE